MIFVVPLVLVLVGALSLRRVLLVTTVDGTSMEPALRPGDRLLVRRTRRVRAGQVVVFRPPSRPGARPGRVLLVKRAVAVPGDHVPVAWEYPDLGGVAGTVVPPGYLVVLGDNRATSWDSRHYGLVRREQVAGVMIRHLHQPGTDTTGLPESRRENVSRH